MTRYSKNKRICPRIWILLFARNLPNKYGKKLLDTATKTEIDAANGTSKKVVRKTSEAIEEFIEKKIAGQNVKPKPVHGENSRNVEEIAIPSEKIQEILHKLRQVL